VGTESIPTVARPCAQTSRSPFHEGPAEFEAGLGESITVQGCRPPFAMSAVIFVGCSHIIATLEELGSPAIDWVPARGLRQTGACETIPGVGLNLTCLRFSYQGEVVTRLHIRNETRPDGLPAK
jgi:hypothetical protein